MPLHRIRAWIDELEKRAGKWTLRALLGVVIIWLAARIIDRAADGVASAMIDRFLVDPLKWVVAQPVGYLLLAALIWVLVLVSLSWWETSSFAKHLKERWETRHGAGSQVMAVRQLKETLEKASSERDQWRHAATGWHNVLRFGAELSIFDPLNETEHVQMVNRVNELFPKMDKAFRSALSVFEELAKDALARGETSPLYWIRARLFELEREWAVTALSALRERLGPKEDPRPFLGCAYTRYQLWRTWILRFAGLLERAPDSTRDYAAWRESDGKFLEDFRSAVLIPSLRGVGRVMREYDETNSPISSLP